MQYFSSLVEFAAHILTLKAAEALALHQGLKKVAEIVEKTAKSEIGEYQPQVGLFQAWPELKDSTKEDRVRQGFTENDPGLRTGAMRNSIDNQVSGLEAVIGSNDDHLVYFELGTKKQEPRAVLGPAALRSTDHIVNILGNAAVSGLLGNAHIDKSLGYDFET